MDPICCLLGICCPPGSAEQLKLLRDSLLSSGMKDDANLDAVVGEVFADFAAVTARIRAAVEVGR